MSIRPTLSAALFALAAILGCVDARLVGVRGALELAPTSMGAQPTSATELNFDLGEAAEGLAPARAVFRLMNAGEAAIGLGSVEWTDLPAGVAAGDANPFAIELPVGRTLAPGETVDVPVSFGLSADSALALPSELSATAIVSAQGAKPEASSVRVTLSARALPNPCHVSELLDFGVVAVGREEIRSVTLTNPFSAPVDATLATPLVAHSDSGAFRYQNLAPGRLRVPESGQREVPLVFRPQFASRYEATAEIVAAPGCNPVRVRLVGEGTQQLFSARPSRVDCGWVWPGLSQRREITFKNHSDRVVRVFAAKIEESSSDTDAGEFSLEPTSWESRDGFELSPGQSAVRAVGCTPRQPGKKGARLAFATDARGEELGEIALSMIAGGPDLALGPAPVLDFGKVAVVSGATLSQARRLWVRNVGIAPDNETAGASLKLGTPTSGGERALPFVRIEALNATTAPQELEVVFPVHFTPASSLLPPPGGTPLEVTARLTPTSVGAKRFKVVFLSNDPDEPEKSIEVLAEAVALPACRYRFSTDPLDFGVAHSTAPKRLTVFFENLGQSANEAFCCRRWSSRPEARTSRCCREEEPPARCHPEAGFRSSLNSGHRAWARHTTRRSPAAG